MCLVHRDSVLKTFGSAEKETWEDRSPYFLFS